MNARCTEIEGRSGAYYALLAGLAVTVAAGLWAARVMEHQGHHVTGMTNQVAWGLPHVFAIFLILAASGALNVASVASVFGKALYRPLAPLSAVLAVALLCGGLAVLVLDLGRPDRLLIALTHFNPRSVFAWNVFLYAGFVIVALSYLGAMLERRLERHLGPLGLLALVWRLALTTGTGCVFGFLVARQAYDAAMMAPLFIVTSLALGLAAYILILVAACKAAARPLGGAVVSRLAGLLATFLAVVVLLTLIFHLTNLYAAEHRAVEHYLLADGAEVTALFWIVQIGLGSLLPIVVLTRPRLRTRARWVAVSAALAVAGGLAQIYVIIIGGQAFPLLVFPDSEVLASSFFDGVAASYRPSRLELMLGIAGVAGAGLIVALALKVLRLLPQSLADEALPGRGATPGARGGHA